MFAKLPTLWIGILVGALAISAWSASVVYSGHIAVEEALRELADGATVTGAFSVKGRHFIECRRVDRHSGAGGKGKEPRKSPRQKDLQPGETIYLPRYGTWNPAGALPVAQVF